ncbi:MAG: SLBB domain-containing protein [Deltaproteobacteria bacterium]|nr:SLBB domain-containing protein [Deltaproteobacteria bacterium]
MDKQNFIDTVRSAGIVGEGGAGFPAHVKYDASVDTVIANGCECEPLLHTDLHILCHEGAAIGRAMRALGDAAGASRLVLGLKKKHMGVASRLREELAAFGVDVFLLDDFYPAGDEQILLREVTGRSVPPLDIPLRAGAIVANVGTLARVSAALEGKAFTDKILTVAGEVANPGLLRAPLGTPLLSCLERCGGPLPPDPVFIIGGPMMGRIVSGLEALSRETVTKTTGGLIALPAGHPLHKNALLDERVMRRRAASACIQCRACSDLCPRGLIGHPFETHLVMRAFAAGNERSENVASAVMCSECGVCEQYACPMGMSPRRVNQRVKGALREARISYAGSRAVREDKTFWREWRKIPTRRLAGRLGLDPYMDIETPFLGDMAPPAVSIPLRQHIGAPARPVVTPGQSVAKGDLVGEIPEGSLGARVHASLSGTVAAILDGAVRIERADQPELTPKQ